MSVTNDQILQRIDAMIAEIVALPQRLTVVGGQVQVHAGLSDISVNLGVVTAGEFRAGNGRDPGKGFTGVRIAYPGMTYSGSDWHIVGVNNDTLQFGLRATDGAAIAGGGVVTLDSDGISIAITSSQQNLRSYKFLSGATVTSGTFGFITGTEHYLVMTANAITNLDTFVQLSASAASGQFSTVILNAAGNTSVEFSITSPDTNAAPNPNPYFGRYIVSAASSNLSSGVEYHDLYFDLSRTITWNSGAITNQRAIRFRAPTYAFSAASTITNAATVYIEGAPVAGTNATITNTYALWIDAGVVRFDGDLRLVGASIRESTALGARAYNSAAFNHNSTGNWLAVTLDSERFDNDGIHSTASNTSRLTAITAGVYTICGSLEFDSNAVGIRGIGIRLNGTTAIALHMATALSGFTHPLSISCQYNLSANDYVEMIAYQNSGGNLNVNASANWSPEFSMVRNS